VTNRIAHSHMEVVKQKECSYGGCETGGLLTRWLCDSRIVAHMEVV